MKKLLFIVLAFAVFAFPLLVHAQSKSEMFIVPPITNPTSLLGQNHKYTVTFRGNGEAVVSSRITLTNTEDQTRDTLSLRVPNVEPTDVIAYQVIAEPSCIRYKPYVYDPANPVREQTCLEYREPDYYNYWSGTAKYQKTQTAVHGDTIDITLPRPVGANKNGSIILYYRAFGYAKKNVFGAYEYAFETLKVEDKIQNLQVGITVDSDLYLKGVKGNVNYRISADTAMLKTAEAGMIAAPMANTQFDQVYRQIGQGSVTKTASNLQPLDSYTVKGSYADSRLKLYAPWVIGGCVVGFVLLIILIFVIRFMVRALTKGAKSSSPSNTTLTSSLLTLGLSGVSTTVILLYTFTLMMIMKSLSSMFPYEYMMLVSILVVIISLAIYGMLLFVPALFMGAKRGLGWGVATAIATIVWLVLVFLFLVIIFGAVRYSGASSPRMMLGSSAVEPMMAPAVDSVSVPEAQVKSAE